MLQRSVSHAAYRIRLNENGVNFFTFGIAAITNICSKCWALVVLHEHGQQNNNKNKWANNNIPMHTPWLCQCNGLRSTYGAHSIILLAMCIVHSFVWLFIYLFLFPLHTFSKTKGARQRDAHGYIVSSVSQVNLLENGYRTTKEWKL